MSKVEQRVKKIVASQLNVAAVFVEDRSILVTDLRPTTEHGQAGDGPIG
jgi:hypothetical protein